MAFTQTPLTLASGSSIRRAILEGAGLEFAVVRPTTDEAAIKAALLADYVSPRNIADALAEAKAVGVSQTVDGLVIGADQVLEVDGRLFDKPRDLREARERLEYLRGRDHRLLGAVVVAEAGRATWRHVAETRLSMRAFSDAFLDAYIEAEGEALLASVGAYRFEGPGAQLFSRVEGDFFAVLGLDLLPLLDYLRLRGAIVE